MNAYLTELTIVALMPSYRAAKVFLTEFDTDKKTLSVLHGGNERSYELLPEFTKDTEWEDRLAKALNTSITLKLRDGKVYDVDFE